MPSGVYKHKPRSKETKKKISETLKGHIVSDETKDKTRQKALEQFKNGMPKETKEKISLTMKGKKKSKEHCKNIGKGHKGINHFEKTKLEISKNRKGKNTGKNNCKWKGDKAGKVPMHKWVERNKGKAKEHKCEHCPKQAKHWANKNHTYKRILEDYMALCVSCHRKYDIKYNNYKLIK